MMKSLKIIRIVAILSFFMISACKKEGEILLTPLKALNPYEISGFVLGDTLEQYFDGVKVREYCGLVTLGAVKGELAFEKDEINMVLKRKSNGETVYQQKFNINNKNNIVPKFYFDGTKVNKEYTYPDPDGADYTANFYLGFPIGSPPADVIVEVWEFYYDANNKIVLVGTKEYPIAKNIEPGHWTSYVKIPIPEVPGPSPQGTEFYPVLVLKNSKTKEYYVNKNNEESSSFEFGIPDQSTSEGRVQSIYFGRGLDARNKVFMQLYDMVQLFPR